MYLNKQRKKDIVKSMYNMNIEHIKNTIEKNIEYNVNLDKSSILDFNIVDELFKTIIIDRLKDDIKTTDELNIIEHILLASPVNDEILENTPIKDLISINYYMVKAFLENSRYYLNNIEEYHKNNDNIKDNEYIEYLVFNINNHELDITDGENIGRYGSSDEVLVLDI